MPLKLEDLRPVLGIHVTTQTSCRVLALGWGDGKVLSPPSYRSFGGPGGRDTYRSSLRFYFPVPSVSLSRWIGSLSQSSSGNNREKR